MKLSHTLFTAGAITAFSFSLASAQERPGQAEQQERSPQAQQQEGQEKQEQYGAREHDQEKKEYGAREHDQEKKKKASELRGTEVKTQGGETLGKVDDYALNLETGELAFILVSEEENGDQWKPIPAPAIEAREENGQMELTVNIDQQEWEQIQSVSEQEIAQLGQEQRARQIYQTFGEDYEARQQEIQFGAPGRERGEEQPGQQEQTGQQEQEGGQQQQQQPGQEQEYGQQQQQQHGAQVGQQQEQEGETRLASKLLQAQLQDQQQQQLGEISDFLIDLEEGRVDFVLIEAEAEEGTFAVAPQALEAIGEDQVRLNVTGQDFQQAQELRQEQIDQYAQQARMQGAQQARQDPQVFRYEEEEGQDSPLFGAPGREREQDGQQQEHEQGAQQQQQQREGQQQR